MSGGHPISLLLFGTLIAVAAIALVLLIRFMSKRGNRHSMDGDRERNIQEIRDEGPTPHSSTDRNSP